MKKLLITSLILSLAGCYRVMSPEEANKVQSFCASIGLISKTQTSFGNVTQVQCAKPGTDLG